MLLAVDTSTRSIGLALYNDTAVISERIWQTQQPSYDRIGRSS